jgi:hypothetical protein
VAIWNSLAGVTPVKKFKDGKAAVNQIWARIQRLGERAEPKAEQPAKGKTERKAKGGAQGAKGAPAKGKSGKKAAASKKTPKGAKAAAKPAEPERRRVNGDGPVRREMKRVRQLAGSTIGYAYSGRVPAARPATDYTARVIPQHSGIAVPLEARILWQR